MRTEMVVSAAVLALVCGTTLAQWNPSARQWGKTDARDLRVMTWNVRDTICSTNTKTEGFNDWTATARIVAAFKPDVLILQETGDNSGNGTGSGVDSVATLTTTVNQWLRGGTGITAFVQKYDASYDLPFVFVSNSNDGFNRNIILSRYPFIDLNGDGRSQVSDLPFISADLYAPGGTGGIRGFQFAEIDLPNALYRGDLVVGNGHLKSGGATADFTDRLNAAKNIAYYIDYLFNGGPAGTTPDPRVRINDAPAATRVLDAFTPVIWGGDMNEDENSNGRDGPVHWMTRADGTGGTDRDRSFATLDDARTPFANNRTTQSSSKLDYLMWQDSIATLRRAFIFNSTDPGMPATWYPNEIVGYLGGAATISSTASDHRPVIADFVLPAPPPPAPGAFNLALPADGAIGQSLTPVLTWSASSNATSYTVRISLNSDLSAPIVAVPGVPGTSLGLGSGVLSECATYYWGVTAVNGVGSTASTPAVFSFSTVIPADYDGSGFVDSDDFILFAEQFALGCDGPGSPDPACVKSADYDTSGFIDSDDFILFVERFNAGC
ncbi:MAG: hypothetical protein SFY95_04425 [Planctomycetota bacterium]|nr:hypothetical protein [Planctomycetota bacterium]